MIRKKRVGGFLLTTMGLHVVVLLLMVSLYSKTTAPKQSYSSLKAVRESEELLSLPFYSVDGMPPECIWEVGKEVGSIQVIHNRLQLPERLPAVVFSADPLSVAAFHANHIAFRHLRIYNCNGNSSHRTYHVYLVAKTNAE
ncbi:hypothetical protein GCM10023188_34500 [Pontibacter saemangeumensis]|uniref:Uncharacterized protein n=1 Tax=Pontibacter saemangeumensis TaxID=1084525 RepID=A0ABP8LY43_9BACT